MKKKSIAILLTAVLLASLFLSCSPQKETHGDGSFVQDTVAPSGPLSYKDFIDSGKTIAAQIGDVYPEVARDFFKAKEVREYASVADMLESMRT